MNTSGTVQNIAVHVHETSPSSIVIEVTKSIEQLEKRAHVITDRLSDKLCSVMIPITESKVPHEPGPLCLYPPLFAKWREHIIGISNAFDAIDILIGRVEL